MDQLKKVFLSASIPNLDRNPKYYDSADTIAIRDAVLAIANIIVPNNILIWGGHPTITPLIREVYEELYNSNKRGTKSIIKSNFIYESQKHVILYQSEFFQKYFPKDNGTFEMVHMIDAVYDKSPSNCKENRESSLFEMRRKMFDENDFKVGIFIGGMEGIEDEFNMFNEKFPNAFLIPLVTTGGATKDVYWKNKEKVFSKAKYKDFNKRFENDYAYMSIISDVFDYLNKCEKF
jgi:hypothetical protein